MNQNCLTCYSTCVGAWQRQGLQGGLGEGLRGRPVITSPGIGSFINTPVCVGEGASGQPFCYWESSSSIPPASLLLSAPLGIWQLDFLVGGSLVSCSELSGCSTASSKGATSIAHSVLEANEHPYCLDSKSVTRPKKISTIRARTRHSKPTSRSCHRSSARP